MNKKVEQALPIALAVAGSVGTIVTAVLAATETPKAMRRIEEKNAKTFGEKFKAAAPVYLPAIGSGLLTVGCTIGGAVVGVKQRNTAMAAAASAGMMYAKLKEAVDKEYGKGTSTKLQEKEAEPEAPSSDSGLDMFYSPYFGYFEAERADVLAGILALETTLARYSVVTLEEFIKHVPSLRNMPKEARDYMAVVGWNTDRIFEYDDSGVLEYELSEPDEHTGVSTLDFCVEPIYYPWEYCCGDQDPQVFPGLSTARHELNGRTF